MSQSRIEQDSMGKIKVPKEALYGAQTQRAVENFPISGLVFSRSFIGALGIIKLIAAKVNTDLKLIPKKIGDVIQRAAAEVNEGLLDEHFPVDIFQTGSGTSTNMNVNEVIANRANFLADGKLPCPVHPLNHVNYGQSSNDVIPSAIRISAYFSCQWSLLPALKKLEQCFRSMEKKYSRSVKNGRTHLMDATPVTFGQCFGGYARQLELAVERIAGAMLRLRELPMGGTAVGTGLNTHPQFGSRFASELSAAAETKFVEAINHFEAQGTVDAPVELSGVLKTTAVGLLKIVNDIRWMNSGPLSGLGEIQLQPVQPGSSIMPGKVNPVIEESAAMVCAQVIGNDAAITVGGLSGNFELNTMLPLVAHNLLESIRLLSNTCLNLSEKSISHISINNIETIKKVEKNPVLATALNPLIGYEESVKIAKKAGSRKKAVRAVASQISQLSKAKLDKLLDPVRMTKGGLIRS